MRRGALAAAIGVEEAVPEARAAALEAFTDLMEKLWRVRLASVALATAATVATAALA